MKANELIILEYTQTNFQIKIFEFIHSLNLLLVVGLNPNLQQYKSV